VRALGTSAQGAADARPGWLLHYCKQADVWPRQPGGRVWRWRLRHCPALHALRAQEAAGCSSVRCRANSRGAGGGRTGGLARDGREHAVKVEAPLGAVHAPAGVIAGIPIQRARRRRRDVRREQLAGEQQPGAPEQAASDRPRISPGPTLQRLPWQSVRHFSSQCEAVHAGVPRSAVRHMPAPHEQRLACPELA